MYLNLYKCSYGARTDYIESLSLEDAKQIFFCRLALSLEFIEMKYIIIEDVTANKSN